MTRGELYGKERAPEEADRPLLERIATVRKAIEARDKKQAELLELLIQPENNGKILTDAWLEVELAQGELNARVRNEIQERLSAI